METERHVTPITIIPAQPGFFILTPIASEHSRVYSEVLQTPVVAWAVTVRYQPNEGRLYLSTPDIDMTDCTPIVPLMEFDPGGTVLLPSGEVESCDQRFPSIAAWLADCEADRLAAEKRRAEKDQSAPAA